jgi:flagellar hook-associated protein 3 FlgL
MKIIGLPDLLSNQKFRSIQADLSRRLAVAGEELTTGQRSDVAKAAKGDLRSLYLLEAGAASEAAFKDASLRAGARIETALGAVEAVRQATDGLAIDLAAAVARGDSTSARRVAAGTVNAFGSAVNALNTSYAGRSLFGGAEVNGAPLPDPQTILDAAFATASGAPDMATARAALSDFFLSPTGGYETTIYQGDDQSTRMQVRDGASLTLSPNALDMPFRQALFGLALAAAIAGDKLPASVAEGDDALKQAAQALLDAQPGMLDISAELGGLAEEAGNAGVAADAMRATLEGRLADVLSIDPYEAATRLSGIQGALEAALTVQSITRGLSIVRFLQ